LNLDDVQSALFLDRTGPAAGTLVLALADRGRARPATDARITLIVQRVVRDVVPEDEVPHVLARPRQERIDLHETELGVPLHDARRGAMGCLIATDGTDPCLVADDRP